MPYDLFEHRHRFAVWAAARATQRGITTVDKLRNALEMWGIREFVSTTAQRETDADWFRVRHRDWCRAIIRDLADNGAADPTFGRAAKLVGVYLKAMIVIVSPGDCSLARLAYPLIDRILLQGIARAQEIDSRYKGDWGKVKWTKLTEDGYYSLIDQLRTVVPAGEPLWTLERFWTVTNDSDG